VTSRFEERPIVVAIAGPNGAGKSTFFDAHLAESDLRFVNADVLAREFALDAYAAADVADSIRRSLIDAGESFVFETVFSDPASAKIEFLLDAAKRGYSVVLVFIGVASAEQSDERVAMRVLQGGHDVPPDKVRERYGRVMRNLTEAIDRLPYVLVFDNSDLANPYRRAAEFELGERIDGSGPLPSWFPRLDRPST